LEYRKFVNVRTMSAMKEHYLQPMEDLGLDHYVILGNHDIVHTNTSKLSAAREIIGHGQSWPATHLIDSPFKKTFGSCHIDFLPWINRGNLTESLDFIEQTSADILIGHLEINGFEMVTGIQCREGMNMSAFKTYDTVYSGHFHKQSKQGNIHYIGTPYELNWGDHGIRKGFHIFDTETGDTDFIVNTSPIYHKILYNDTTVDYDNMDVTPYTDTYVSILVEQKDKDLMFERFVDNIQKYCYDLSITDAESFDISNDDMEIFDIEDSLSILINSVDSIETKLDKNAIKKKIGEIYKRAEEQLDI
jgi:DNA repair exonuclease SbcCD nuclease subunit